MSSNNMSSLVPPDRDPSQVHRQAEVSVAMINYRAFEGRLIAFLDEGNKGEDSAAYEERDAYDALLDEGDKVWYALSVQEMRQINREGLLRGAKEGALAEAAVEWGEELGLTDVRKINEEAKARISRRERRGAETGGPTISANSATSAPLREVKTKDTTS